MFSTSHTCQLWRISDFSTSVMGRHLKFLLDSTYLPPPHLPTNIAHSFPTQLEFTIYLHDIYWNKIFNVGLEYNGIKPRSHRKTASEM